MLGPWLKYPKDLRGRSLCVDILPKLKHWDSWLQTVHATNPSMEFLVLLEPRQQVDVPTCRIFCAAFSSQPCLAPQFLAFIPTLKGLCFPARLCKADATLPIDPQKVCGSRRMGTQANPIRRLPKNSTSNCQRTISRESSSCPIKVHGLVPRNAA